MLFRPYRFRDHRSLWGRWQARRRERDTLEVLAREKMIFTGLPCPSEYSHGGFVRAILYVRVYVSPSGTVSPNLSITDTDLISREDRCLGVPRVGVICARSGRVDTDTISLDKLFREEEQRINTALHRTTNDMIGIKTNGLNDCRLM